MLVSDLYQAESAKIIGLAMQAHRELGYGFRDKTYENALVVLLKKDGIEYSQQTMLPIVFHGEKIDEFIPDLILYGKIIVDL